VDIKRSGSQPSSKGPADWFTGTVRIDPLFSPPEPARVAGALESTRSDVVELCYGPETDDPPTFMKQCDARLKSQLDSEELKRLFDLIELTPTEWFAS
jgi:hypothetical protein